MLNPDCRDILSAFAAERVEFLLVGAYALAAPEMVFQVGRAPRRIDLLTGIDGVAFDEAWRGHIEVIVDGLTVPVIGRSEYLKNKRATGRLRDLADIEALGESAD